MENCRIELMNLLDKQIDEVYTLLYKLGFEEKQTEESKKIRDQFRNRKAVVEK